MNKIEPKWLTMGDLDINKVNPSLAPVYNVILQFGYDATDPKIKPLFQREEPKWFTVLGWDPECDDAFWQMLMKVYGNNKSKLEDWGSSWSNLKRFKNSPPGFEYTLNSTPIANKDAWKKYNKIKNEVD